MREIIFRGKRTDNGEWVEGYYVRLYGSNGKVSRRIYTGCAEVDCGNYYPDFFDVIPTSVGQYTGLKDRNGKRIFEGDIFKFPDEVWESYSTECGTEYNSWEVENYGVVGFAEYSGRFDFTEYKFNENSVEADLHENRDIEFYEFISGLEIIGNTHDNPELIGGNE